MLPTNILYLRRKNFSLDGKLNVFGFENKLIIVFIHGDFCGYCKVAAPEFIKASKEFINDTEVAFTAIQIDGKAPGEKETREIIPKIVSEYKGVPEYAFFYNGKPLFETLEGRKSEDIKKKIIQLKKKYM